jgi:hypothetical protein
MPLNFPCLDSGFKPVSTSLHRYAYFPVFVRWTTLPACEIQFNRVILFTSYCFFAAAD